MIIKAFFTNSFGILFSRILGFIRDLMTASVLGANIYSDIFFVAFKLPNLFRRIFGEGAFSQAFIPSFTKAKNKGQFSYDISIRLLGVVTLLSLFITFFSQLITSLIAYGFDEATQIMTAPLVGINIWYLNFIFVVSFFAALLQYKKHFATTAFSTALLNLSLISALLLAQGLEKLEIVYYLSYGVVIGGFLQLIVHLIAAHKHGLCKLLIVGKKEKQIAKYKNEEGQFYKSFFPAIFASSASHLSAFLDTFLASFLVSGSISYLYFANRILQLPLALFAIALSTALFPTIARAINNSDLARANQGLYKATWMLLVFLSLSTIGAVILSEEIMMLLFERGAFTHEDTLNSSEVLLMYMVGLLPFGLAKLFQLWHFSHHQQKMVAKFTAISLGFNIVLSLALISPMGAPGLALASSLSGSVLFVLNFRAYLYSGGVNPFSMKNLALLVVGLTLFSLLLVTLKSMILL
jgi:putative peptidoglycan lipid II flippase